MELKSCKDCRFWYRVEGKHYGVCRSSPAQVVVINDQIKAYSPFQKEDDIECGEFEPSYRAHKIDIYDE